MSGRLSSNTLQIHLAWIVVALSTTFGTLIIFNTRSASSPARLTSITNRQPAVKNTRMVWTDAAIYRPGQSINFSFINTTSKTLLLPNSSPWKILDSSNQTVFTPVSLQAMIELAPNQSRSWAWDQKNSQGKPVANGIYKVVFEKYDYVAFIISNNTK